MEDCPLVLPDPNRHCRSVRNHDALATRRRTAPVLALAGSNSYSANVLRPILGHVSRDWLGFLADGSRQNQGSAAAGRDLSKPCALSCRDSLGRDINAEPKRLSDGCMGFHLRFRGRGVGLPLLLLSKISDDLRSISMPEIENSQ